MNPDLLQDQSVDLSDPKVIGAAFRRGIRERISGPAFGSYFIAATCVAVDDTEITFAVRDNFCKEAILGQYITEVKSCLVNIGLGEHRVRWAVTRDETAKDSSTPDVACGQPEIDCGSDQPSIVGAINIPHQHGDTTLVAIPMVRHFLFAPDKTKLKVRHYSVELKHKGKRFTQTFHIGDMHAASGKGYGVLTVKHQKALFVLQDLWQQQGGKMVDWQGSKLGFVTASSFQLESRMFGSRGGRQKTMLRQTLQELVSIPVAVRNYVDADGEITDVDVTGLLAGAQFNQAGNKRGAWVQVVLGSLLTRAFERSNFKPLTLSVVDKLPDVPALLYPKLDYMLYNNPKVTWRLPTLVQNLGLTGEITTQRSRRRRLFISAAGRLDGQSLSRPNHFLRVHVSEGAAIDGEDLLIATTQVNRTASKRKFSDSVTSKI